MIKNKKGQGVVAFFIVLGIFFFLWASWLGGFLQEWGAKATASGDFNGFELFLINNLNLWIFLGLIIAVFFAITFGGNR